MTAVSMTESTGNFFFFSSVSQRLKSRGITDSITDRMPTKNLSIPINWQVVDDQGIAKLTRQFKFPDFKSALNFVNQVGQLAEKYHHHPLLELAWGQVTVWWWTHQTQGLTELDFRLAEQTNHL